MLGYKTIMIYESNSIKKIENKTLRDIYVCAKPLKGKRKIVDKFIIPAGSFLIIKGDEFDLSQTLLRFTEEKEKEDEGV